MDEEKRLLRRIAQVARELDDEERADLDERWDALAAGTLPAEQAAALMAEVEGNGGSSMRSAAAEAFAPLEPEFRKRLHEQARAGLAGAARGDRDGDAADRAPTVPAVAPPAVTPPTVALPAAAPPIRSWLLWGAGLAAALALAIALPILWTDPDRPVMAAYRFELPSGAAPLRDPAPLALDESLDEPRVFAAGSAFELVLRPYDAEPGPLEAALYLRHGGALRRFTAPLDVAATGVVRVAGEVGVDVELPPGESELLVALGRPDALPSGETLARRLESDREAVSDDWVAWRVALVYREAP